MDKWIFVAVLAFTGGTIGFYSGIPLGTLLGSLFAVGGYQFVRKNLPTFSFRAKKSCKVSSEGVSASHLRQKHFRRFNPFGRLHCWRRLPI